VGSGHFFIGPDNGCLSGVLPAAHRGRRGKDEAYTTRQVVIPSELTVHAIENASLFLPEVSATFEGRDVFAPAAAYLAQGGAIDSVGPRLESIEAFSAFRAPVTAAGVEGLILRSDRFGNLITDIRAEDIGGTAEAVVGGRRIPIVSTYATGTGLCALAGSGGYIEFALPNGSAAEELGARAGEKVLVAAG
jgi:S-adenosylmethionine hydrolase